MSETDPLSLIQPAATRVRDPITGRSVWLAGMIREAKVEAQGASQVLTFELWFTPQHGRNDRKGLEQAMVANVRAGGFKGEIKVIARMEQPSDAPGGPAPAAPAAPAKKPSVAGMNTPGAVAPHGGPISKKKLPGVKHIICVASGKGGVGKSTVAINLAVALQRQGLAVGLMDADIYGPSLPTMMGVNSRPLADNDKKIVPVNAYGVRCLSIGMLVPAEQAIIWRGPMVMGALRQFLQDTRWGDLDVLVVDMPPGTGDAQLSLIQSVDISGAVIVTTPQKVALDDAIRGIAMFRQLDVPILGLVENMAWYELPDGTRDFVFGEGGGVRTAADNNTSVLGQLPLQTQLRASADAGQPAALRDDALGGIFADIASQVSASLGFGVA
ncbi:MAG: Mrp/NBP35 family ATP-binding protein [Myxococcota bacterium]